MSEVCPHKYYDRRKCPQCLNKRIAKLEAENARLKEAAKGDKYAIDGLGKDNDRLSRTLARVEVLPDMWEGSDNSLMKEMSCCAEDLRSALNQQDKEQSDKCESGCVTFTGGERRHHKDCVYYPESLSKMLDDAKAKLARVEALPRYECHPEHYDFGPVGDYVRHDAILKELNQ